MIDDPWKTDLLMSMLREALPIEANITQFLAAELMEKSPEMVVPKNAMSQTFSIVGTAEVYSAVWI